jgi:putative FmdB family regulatory protein
MPTYEYRCEACGHEFEEVQKISDPPIDRCPKCKKKKARRQISQGNFILKGGGWYVTDYKSGSGGKKKKDADEKSEKTSDTKADKPDKADDASKSPTGDKPKKKASGD